MATRAARNTKPASGTATAGGLRGPRTQKGGTPPPMFFKTNTDAAPRRRGGQPGNSNATKHGRHTAEMRALRAEVRFLVTKTRALAKIAWCLELPPRSASEPADYVAPKTPADRSGASAPVESAPPAEQERPPQSRCVARPAQHQRSRLQRPDVRRAQGRDAIAAAERHRRQSRRRGRSPPPFRRSQVPQQQRQQCRRGVAAHPRLLGCTTSALRR